MGFTKRIFSLGLIMWLALGSCKKQELTADSGNGTAYVKEVTRAEGRVYSDSAQQRYILRVPNGFDSHDAGYVCNLPLEFQKKGWKCSSAAVILNTTSSRLALPAISFIIWPWMKSRLNKFRRA